MKTKYLFFLAVIVLMFPFCKNKEIKPEIIINPDFLIGKQRKMTGHYIIYSNGELRDLIEWDTIFTGKCWLNTIYEYTETEYLVDYECPELKDHSLNWSFNNDSSSIFHIYQYDYEYDTIEYKILELSENILKTLKLSVTDSSKVISTFEVIK